MRRRPCMVHGATVHTQCITEQDCREYIQVLELLSLEKTARQPFSLPPSCPPSAINISGDGSREWATGERRVQWKMASCTTVDDDDDDNADYDDAAVAAAGVMWRAGCCCWWCSYGVVMHASRVLMNTLPSISPPENGVAWLRRDAKRQAWPASSRFILSLKMPVVNPRDSLSALLHFAIQWTPSFMLPSRPDVLYIVCNDRIQMKASEVVQHNAFLRSMPLNKWNKKEQVTNSMHRPVHYSELQRVPKIIAKTIRTRSTRWVIKTRTNLFVITLASVHRF